MTPDETWLQTYIRDHGAVAGTVHRRSGPDELALAAAVNIPPPVQQIVKTIPRGKGMAGLAFAQNEPITTCNIKDDRSGQVRPGAKAVDARAAVALPVHDAAGEVRAIVGIAFMEERTLAESELAGLAKAAASLP